MLTAQQAADQAQDKNKDQAQDQGTNQQSADQAQDQNKDQAQDQDSAAAARTFLEGNGDIPEKFKAAKDDGSIDLEKTLANVSTAYMHLEKKLGAGDIPPKEETGYKLDYSKFPADADIKIDPEKEKTFLKYMHGLGLSNRQAQGIINKYADMISEGITIKAAHDKKLIDEAHAEVAAAWGSDLEANKARAITAFNAVMDQETKQQVSSIGQDMKLTYGALLKALAYIGRDLQEDQPPAGKGNEDSLDIESLMLNPAYKDKNHPDHKRIAAQVRSYFERKAAAEKG